MYRQTRPPGCPAAHPGTVACASANSRTTTVEFLREAVGVVGRELSEELALNSSELRLSEASLSPLLMELLSSQLQERRDKGLPLKQKPRQGSKSSYPWRMAIFQGRDWPKGESLGISPGFASNSKYDLNFLIIW